MTLLAAWIRTLRSATELIVASDSRVTGGKNWDCCPKLFPLARGDGVLGLSGDTDWSLVIMAQIANWCADFGRAEDRAMDLSDVKGHVERIANEMLSRARYAGDDPSEEFSMILAGYSWRSQKFAIWRSRGSSEGALRFRRVRKHFAFAGDCESDAARETVKRLNGKRELGWEPLQTLVEYIRDEDWSTRSIGGPPQVVKVYRYLSTMPLAVRWNHGGRSETTLFGRPLLSYERTRRLILDPDTMKTEKAWDYIKGDGEGAGQ